MMLLVGTAKGLFRLVDDGARQSWRIEGPYIEGYSVLHTTAAPDGTLYAATAHKIWGAHIYASRDNGASWTTLDAVPQHPPASGHGATKSIWYLAASGDVLFAGIDPAGLFRSDDKGRSWQAVAGLNEHPTRTPHRSR